MSEEAATSEPIEAVASEEAVQAEASDRPDWLLEKFKSPEDQARAYNDLYGAYSRKTDKLREEIKAETETADLADKGIPDTIDGYEYPDGFDAPVESVDSALKTWAKNNNISKDAFNELIGDVYSQTKPNLEVEFKNLGDNAKDRIGSVNNWITKNIDESQHDQVHNLMGSAKGVEFFESIMELTGSRGFAPEGGETRSSTSQMTREDIREAQADPRFGEDPAYTQKVRDMWGNFATQGG
tara:strand:- start:4257 stop:4976 length:720 start_codon:yes stop_codon:yes gene_type:complete